MRGCYVPTCPGEGRNGSSKTAAEARRGGRHLTSPSQIPFLAAAAAAAADSIHAEMLDAELRPHCVAENIKEVR